jgi:transformation/transcription domain-associated protein
VNIVLYYKVNESSTTVGSPGEALSKRCVLLLKTALKPGFWQGKIFMRHGI